VVEKLVINLDYGSSHQLEGKNGVLKKILELPMLFIQGKSLASHFGFLEKNVNVSCKLLVKILVMSGVIGAKDSACFTHKNLFINKTNYVHEKFMCATL